MLFNTTHFFLFLVVVLALFYASPRVLRRYILLAASYFFYGSWNVKFIPLLLTLTAIDYTAGLWIERTPPGPRRKGLLILSLSANLGFLGFFKYYNFLASNLCLLIGKPTNSFFWDIVLPLGISFHTFQSMSYVVDVYRGQQKAVRDPFDYALFICFFPQLVAGPIVRARNFFRDLLDWHPPTGDDVSLGILLLFFGLTKKMAFADQFAKIANGYFANVGAHPGWHTAWSGVIAFGMQIYFDFSGYTDMAIGMAKLLGFHFPVNFRRPYLASSITDFWRRWHISLSSWLRDYLYISLGGNRKGKWMTYRNLMLTMLLGGLWHGASWNFLIWGGYHGGLLAVERAAGEDRPSGGWRLQLLDALLLVAYLLGCTAFPLPRGGNLGQLRDVFFFLRVFLGLWLAARALGRWLYPLKSIFLSRWLYPLRAILTFLLVMIGWVFFRAVGLAQSRQVLAQMFSRAQGGDLLTPWHVGLIVLALLLAVAEEKLDWFDRVARAPVLVYATALALMFLCLELFGVIDARIPFIYFQF
jgi:D-alanyl-lipoteichoic acid acyltransferase DltB (MBOAT superfamily)